MVTISHKEMSNLLRKTSLALAALCSLLYFWLVRPLQNELERARSNLETLTLLIERKELERKRLANSCNAIKESQKELRELSAPVSTQPMNLIYSLLELASAHNTSIKWHGPSNSRGSPGRAPREDFVSQLFSLELEGQYHNLRSYFRDICQLNQSLGIDRFEIKTTPKHPNILRAKLVLKLPPHQSSRHDKRTNP